MDRSDAHPAAADEHDAPHHVHEEECWALLDAAMLGRLALVRPDGYPEIFPVNHQVHDGVILLRTARGAKLEMIAERPQVAFEVDGEDDESRWSVVVKGTASQITSEMELHRTGVIELASWTPTRKQFVVKIVPDSVTGRRFDRGTTTAGPVYAVAATGAIDVTQPRSRADRPTPIPHFGLLRHTDGKDADGCT